MAAENNRFEEKLDDICKTVNSIDKDVSTMKVSMVEREKSEILRNEVIVESMKSQLQIIVNNAKRIDKIEGNQSKIVWLVLSLVITAVIGGVLII